MSPWANRESRPQLLPDPPGRADGHKSRDDVRVTVAPIAARQRLLQPPSEARGPDPGPRPSANADIGVGGRGDRPRASGGEGDGEGKRTARGEGSSGTAEADLGGPAKKGRSPRPGVSSIQRRAIEALVTTPTRAAAAAKVGVHERTIRRWFQQQAFREAHDARLDEVLEEPQDAMAAAHPELWATFIDLTHSRNESTRLRAITWFYDRLDRQRAHLLSRRDRGGALELPRALRALYEELENPDTEHGRGDAQ